MYVLLAIALGYIINGIEHIVSITTTNRFILIDLLLQLVSYLHILLTITVSRLLTHILTITVSKLLTYILTITVNKLLTQNTYYYS